MNDHCPICQIENPTWPVVDVATGWRFCGGCFQAAQDAMRPLNDERDAFSEWLRAIALCREERVLDARIVLKGKHNYAFVLI